MTQFNMEAYRIAKEIVARQSNADAVKAYARVAWTMPEDGDVEAGNALIGAIVGEMLYRMGTIEGFETPEDIVRHCLRSAAQDY